MQCFVFSTNISIKLMHCKIRGKLLQKMNAFLTLEIIL